MKDGIALLVTEVIIYFFEMVKVDNSYSGLGTAF